MCVCVGGVLERNPPGGAHELGGGVVLPQLVAAQHPPCAASLIHFLPACLSTCMCIHFLPSTSYLHLYLCRCIHFLPSTSYLHVYLCRCIHFLPSTCYLHVYLCRCIHFLPSTCNLHVYLCRCIHFLPSTCYLHVYLCIHPSIHLASYRAASHPPTACCQPGPVRVAGRPCPSFICRSIGGRWRERGGIGGRHRAKRRSGEKIGRAHV